MNAKRRMTQSRKRYRSLANTQRYEVLIFITGAATLALEVLASRIMTPYFGVSLYIWASILSITLTFLAVGYYLGGRVSKRFEGQHLESIFLAAPAASALSIALASALYPVLFPLLSGVDLIFGSFLGSFLLLALPLTALSAMNPMLIALQRRAQDKGDGGAGRVFFISTIGSVAGVLLTAFLFIPNVTNFRAVLLLGLALCLAVVVLAFRSAALSRSGKRRVIASCAVAAILCGSLLLGQQRYMTALSTLYDRPFQVDVRAEYTSMFGNIKIVHLRPQDEKGEPMLAYLQEGLIQNRATLDGDSLSLYTYVLDSLAHAFVPDARDVVVLGLGAGVLPRDFKEDGLRVSVVDINADALRAATNHFGFDPKGVDVQIEDARTFVRRCDKSYDIVILDLFQGDGMPDYLLTREFFRDVKACLRKGGAAIMNAFLDDYNESPNRRLHATVAAEFPRVVEYRAPTGNAFIVATLGDVVDVALSNPADIPPDLRESLDWTLSSGRAIRRQDLVNIRPVTDDHNVFSVLFADAELRLRRYLTGLFPPHVLVN